LSDPAGSDLYTTCKEIRLLGKFQPDSFKTRRLACVETDGQTDMARSTRLAMLIKNIYTLWGRKRMLHCVANFWLKSMYPLQGYNYFWKQFYAWIWEYSFSEPRRLVQELRQLIFKQENGGRHRRWRSVGVRVGVALCWNKLALRRNLRNLHA